MNANDEVVPIAQLFYDDAGRRDDVVPIAELFYDSAGRDDVVPIAELFYDAAGAHIARAGHVPLAPAERKFTPARGRELHSLLNTSIAQLSGVSGDARRKTPTPSPVPIATLLYRGRAALERALEVRQEIRQAGSMPQRETLEELLDLVALSATE